MISGEVRVIIPPNISREIQEKLDMGLDDFADLVLSKSQEFVPVDEGMLKKSGDVDRGWLQKRIEYDSMYAAFVEFGTSPHFPPVEPLQQWARRHGINDWENAGWRIARKIAREGTIAQPFLRPAVDYAIPWLPELIRSKFR